MKIHISCSKGFFVILAALIYLDGQGVVLWSLFACVMHELGHGILILLLGGRVRKIRITAVGAAMELDSSYPLSYGKEIVAALAGPIVNLIIAGVSVLFRWHLFAGINICFGILNLIPIYSLDGGRALMFALTGLGFNMADMIIQVASIVFSGVLLGLGWAAWRSWGNITLFCTALWLAYKVIMPSTVYVNRLSSSASELCQ